jgi:hypothetical protein
MQSRPAETETAVMFASAVHAMAARPMDGFARVISRFADEPEEVDARLYLFGLCKPLQTTCLDRRGIDCLIDGDDAGRLPETVCRMLGIMVCELVKDASERTIAPRTVMVTLSRRGALCLCMISRQGLADSYADTQPGLQRVLQLAAELDGGCMIRSMPERGTIAIMFDARVVEPRLPAAIRRYRAGAARGRAVEPISAVPE